jgi:hypothetical protein
MAGDRSRKSVNRVRNVQRMGEDWVRRGRGDQTSLRVSPVPDPDQLA